MCSTKDQRYANLMKGFPMSTPSIHHSIPCLHSMRLIYYYQVMTLNVLKQIKTKATIMNIILMKGINIFFFIKLMIFQI